jgi:DNA-binding NarL/FixJ family response regulator/tetratricopeptide (TPR) repeat protein
VSRDLGVGARRLVGRVAELDQLARAVATLERRSPTVVDLVGEPGTGKTALLAELAERLGRRPVLRTRATELDRTTPGGLLARALDGHATAESYRARLLDLAEPSGVALLLDDVHLADDDSLTVLDQLLTTLPEAGVLVALAYRPRQVPLRLLGTLAAPEVAGRRERIELAPLTTEDAAALVNAAAGPAHPEQVLAAGDGNPLYLLALAHVTDDQAGVPGQLRAAVLSDVDSASPGARRLAMAAAVVGDSFDPDVAVEVGGLDRTAATSAIDELHRRDVIRPEPGKLMRFRHPLLRRLIYDGTPPGWRRSAHRAAITALRGRGASALAEAEHLERCAGTGDLDAVEVLLRAADLAGPREPANAARWLRDALALVPEADARAWLPHRIRLARYLLLAGRFVEAREALREAGTQRAEVTEIVVLRATVERLLGNHNDARRQLAAELALSTPGTPAHAELALELATVDLMEGTASARTVELAGRASTAPGGSGTVAHAVAATANYLLGDLDAAISHCDHAARGLDELTDPELAGRLDVCLWTGWVENTLSRYLRALAHFDRGIELARHTGQTHLLCHLLTGRAVGRRWLGRLPSAREDVDEAVEVAHRCGSDELRALASGTRAFVGVLGDDLEVARGEAEAVVQLAGPDTGWWATQAGFVAAVAQAEDGEPGPAGRRLLTIGGGPDLPKVDPLGRPAWYELLTRSAMADGDRTLAAAWAARAAASADVRLPLGAGLAALAHAEALRPADPATAEHTRQAIELFAAAGTPVEQARATTVLAGCLAATGQTAAARKLAYRAADRYTACGSARLATRARAPFGEAAGRPALSPREREVAMLVSRGHTNRQIAERLHVTEKTVETYLSRIFTKLDMTSRAALAAWAVAAS